MWQIELSLSLVPGTGNSDAYCVILDVCVCMCVHVWMVVQTLYVWWKLAKFVSIVVSAMFAPAVCCGLIRVPLWWCQFLSGVVNFMVISVAFETMRFYQ